MEILNKKIIGKCPHCGANVVKTGRGWKCENSIGDNPTCTFIIYYMIGNRIMRDDEIAELLDNRVLLCDGFAKEDKTVTPHKRIGPFPMVLTIADDFTVKPLPSIGKCPACGSDVRVTAKGYVCTNYKNDAKCRFVIWRTINGHIVSLKEAQEILTVGMTNEAVDMYRDDGFVFRKKLGISPDKLQILKI